MKELALWPQDCPWAMAGRQSRVEALIASKRM